jgi:hypothetical protein
MIKSRLLKRSQFSFLLMGVSKQVSKQFSKSRFLEDASNRNSIYSVADEFLVQCPRCQNCAKIFKRDSANPSLHSPRRLSCLHCGYSKDWNGTGMSFGAPRDPCFGLPLWFQVPCSGHILWAYNLRHLNIIEQYVVATLREKRRHPQWGWQNQSLFNRLPHWIKAAHNRQRVLKTIAKLKEK